MRSAASLAIVAVAIFAGCRSNSTPMANPFLTPDRVPPPTTQLAPGMAAPYYQGDAMPNAAPLAVPAAGMPQIPTAGAPAGAYLPPTGAPPASAYPAAPAGSAYPAGSTYPAANPVTPTAPLNYGASAAPAAKGDAVGVPNDEQSLRFAAASLTPTSTPSPAAVAASATKPTASQFRAPIQSMLPVAGSMDEGAARAFTPNAGAPAPNAASQATSSVTQASFDAPVAATATGTTLAADGFRPQGSQPRTEAAVQSSGATGFRPPSIGKQTAAGDNPNGRYGVGSKQEWLRGQLEYWPERGEWSINYMDEGAKDQIGGRVLIDNPQVLANLSPGEFVAVEGQLFGRQIDESSYMPAYRVSSVQRQRQ
ncbi:hypothetical protein [Lacipirellula sp.]|uniref:hypothetical protein n=1 Tax=Lacipirellula sp. TaxID=2691419 RepID=UPI003D0F0F15